MDTKFKEISDFAVHLQQCSKTQSQHEDQEKRTSIHKSYYSAFHACRSLSLKLPTPSNYEGGEHAKIIAALQTVEIASVKKNRKNWLNIKKAGLKLKAMRDLRHSADYELGYDITEREVETQLKECQKLHQLLSDIQATLTSKSA
ncbi:HEPN domain-containing protein [Marinomonas atlantica]|uniref:HEPN domain-containing protein n=1 Tax=Marinomonas atlantica TaxID=1806668 RepID=UPI00082DED97|nr:HEPN domain-containing protein [Marinomonas atlantica]